MLKLTAILSKSRKITVIDVSYPYKKHFHVCDSNLLALVGEKFLPINGRAICQKVFYLYIPCFKSQPIISNQLMGDLPKNNVQLDYCFNDSGVDLCGPFMFKVGYAHWIILQRKLLYCCLLYI